MSGKIATTTDDLSFLETLKIHCLIWTLQLKHFWYHTDQENKMKVTTRMLRTKQFLILGTSLLFVSLTVWFGTHPEEHPVIRQIPREHIPAKRTTIPFPNLPALQVLGLAPNGSRLPLEPEPSNGEQHDGGLHKKKGHHYIIPKIWTVELSNHVKTDEPVLATALFDENMPEILKLIQSVKLNVQPSRHLMIYHIKVKDTRRHKVEIYCNITEVCSLYQFPYSMFPSHVQKKAKGAYKPIIILKSLELFPSVLWLDGDDPITGNGTEAILEHTSNNSMSLWPMGNKCGASSYTLKKMLYYFSLIPSDLYFSNMIQSNRYGFHRSSSTADVLFLWIKCTLTQDCVSPPGAEQKNCDDGCQASQPVYKYLGCHMYEASALSATLKKLGYNIPSDRYSVTDAQYPLIGNLNMNISSSSIEHAINDYQDREEKIRLAEFGPKSRSDRVHHTDISDE